jgi:Ca-activated chloride channel family protein
MENVRLKLTGKSGTLPRSYLYNNLRFPLREEANDYLPRLWATRRVGWLMEQIRSNGEQKELRDEVVDLGTRYGIVTPYTSYLALEANQTSRDVSSLPLLRRGAGGLRPGSLTNMPAPKAADATTGGIAVQQSKRAREQQETAVVVNEDSPTSVRRVAGKTFYLRDEVWTDSEFKMDSGLPETVLTFGSDDYFALLKKEPRLASFFALGEKLVLVFEGRIYRVNAVKP